jgi:glycosyltransferase involved in cell wall biosynthesis
MTTENTPTISVLCPTYNEKAYITQLLEFFVHAEPKNKEIIIADGMSTDGTREIIKEWQVKYPYIKLIDNPNKYVSFGLNEAIKQATGEYIARVDAHTQYPNDYLTNCLEVSKETGAENVGGYIFSKGKTTIGKAISVAMSTSFGVGNTEFRTAVVDGYVDSVPFGFWKKTFFDTFGYFDTELIRNQDDEFNYRTNKLGGKIFQSSKISSAYYVRDSFKAMYRQYYQYGYFKPLVFKKLGNSGVRIRHLIPGAFFLYFITLPLSILFWPYIIPLFLYLILNIYFSFKSEQPFIVKTLTIPAYILLHMAYGSGFLVGLWKWRNR